MIGKIGTVPKARCTSGMIGKIPVPIARCTSTYGVVGQVPTAICTSSMIGKTP